jgi:hypothetical protein
VQGGSECVEEIEANVDRLDVKEFEVNLRTRFAEEEGLQQLEQGNGGAASTGVQAGNWLEDACCC